MKITKRWLTIVCIFLLFLSVLCAPWHVQIMTEGKVGNIEVMILAPLWSNPRPYPNSWIVRKAVRADFLLVEWACIAVVYFGISAHLWRKG
jgi:hypothetical protein